MRPWGWDTVTARGKVADCLIHDDRILYIKLWKVEVYLYYSYSSCFFENIFIILNPYYSFKRDIIQLRLNINHNLRYLKLGHELKCQCKVQSILLSTIASIILTELYWSKYWYYRRILMQIVNYWGRLIDILIDT